MTTPVLRRPISALLLGLGLCTACIPVHDTYWRASTTATQNMKCDVSPGTLRCELQHRILFAVGGFANTQSDGSGYFSLEIPAGHSIYLKEPTVTLASTDMASPWKAQLATASGFRYASAESSEKIDDPRGSPVTRQLLGSTWNTHHFSEKASSRYVFDIRSDRKFPTVFSLELPMLVIDGADFAIPEVTFRYGRWTTIKGLFGT